MDVWNRHRESKNTKFTKLVQVRNFIHLFEFKRFFEMRKEIHNRSMLTAFTSSTQPTRGARSAQSCLVSSSSESQPSYSEARTQLSDFFQIPKILRLRPGAWGHSHPPALLLSGIFILTSLNDTSSPRMRGHLRGQLYIFAIILKNNWAAWAH